MASKAKSSRSRGAKAKGMTKAQLTTDLAAKTGLTKAQVNDVFAALSEIVGDELQAGRPVTVPSLVKVTLVRRPATQTRPGMHPFTKEPITIKAKPARNVVRVRALKALKDQA